MVLGECVNPYMSNIKIKNKSISNGKYTEYGLMLDKLYKDIQNKKQKTLDEI